ncbi:YihY/virulence factor BrkB family protein [Microtetraspora malaysiensis]|uniref:YihY/virulence factor BrkB family protein n=1 Tax=Microtetraspora malaysiensis TaxID=161358 RepID=UPI00083061D1|nr:YihY/virulence factor BrkB family protein [Microtetraspora malaysiensis]
MFGRITRFVERVRAGGRRLMERERVRFPWFDHLVRTAHRYEVQSGSRLAGSLTYFAFLSFFPLVALAFALLGFVLAARPDARTALTDAINQQLPGLADRLEISRIADARAGAGVFGLVGLLYAGLGAVDALRFALREIWMSREPPLDFLRAKLRDLIALLLTGVTLLVSAAIGAFAVGATSTVAGWLGVGGSEPVGVAVWLTGFLAGLVADLVLFLIIFAWLARAPQPFRVVLGGALLGAFVFGVLKQLATLILSHTLTNPVYGTFAVVVGMLVWINLSARVVLYAAAWTATSGMGPPPEPTPVPSPALPA